MANEFVTTEHTQVLQKLIREVVNDPSTYMGSKYLPSVALPVDEIYTEVVEASGGLTNEHVPGTDPKYVQSFGTRIQKFSPPKYKEAIHYDEDKILRLRRLGDNGRNVRGIRQYIDLDADRLNRRLEARIELLRWNAIFNGTFSYMGKTFSYGIPSRNRATPLSAAWATGSPLVANASAKPVDDIRYWLMGGLDVFRKYKVRKMVMNPNTARFVVSNPNTLSYLTSYGANVAIKGLDINTVLGFLLPGCPPCEIYDGWYQTEATGSGNTSTGLAAVAGQLTVSDAIYFVPDGYIYFEVSNLPGGDIIGEFVQGVHLAEGTIDEPGYGKFFVVDDNIGPGTKGGPKNPYMDLVSGVYGGVKLDRPFDVLTGYVL